MIYSMRTDSFPAWHPLFHHSFVLCFLLTMVLLPVMYIKFRQPPYWVLLLIFCSFVTIYATYWVSAFNMHMCICVCFYADGCELMTGFEKQMFLCILFRERVRSSHPVEPSTVAIPPSSHRVNPSSSTLRPNADQSSADSTHGLSIDIPPTYEMALSQTAVELPVHSPPSYHSAKEDEENNPSSHHIHHIE